MKGAHSYWWSQSCMYVWLVSCEVIKNEGLRAGYAGNGCTDDAIQFWHGLLQAPHNSMMTMFDFSENDIDLYSYSAISCAGVHAVAGTHFALLVSCLAHCRPGGLLYQG